MHNNRDNSLMQVQPDEQFLKNYQAVYYAMNAKPDCIWKVFPKQSIIEMDDLHDLNRKITEKFKAHYEEAGFMINVTVAFSDRTSIDFNSWTTFESYDWTDKRVVDNIIIKWEYNAKLPQYQLPQKHTLVVRLANEISPEEMINLVVTGKLEEMKQIEQESCPIIARVDFINSILAEELINIVDEWQEGLASWENEEPAWFKGIRKFRRAIAYVVNYLTVLITILLSLKYLAKILTSLNVTTLGELKIETFKHILICGIILVFLCWIVDKVFGMVANIIFITLGNYKNCHTFNITKGDKNKCKQIKDKFKKSKFKVCLNLIFTLIFNVICSIIANNIPLFF